MSKINAICMVADIDYPVSPYDTATDKRTNGARNMERHRQIVKDIHGILYECSKKCRTVKRFRGFV